MESRTDGRDVASFGSPAHGWVLYDAACGFCSWWVPLWQEVLGRRGFAIAPLQSPWVRPRLALEGVDVLRDLRLLLVDGNHIEGADVYRYVMRRIWWALPVYGLSIAPVFSTIFDGAYRSFATNRYRVSEACKLPGKADAKHTH